MILQQLYNDADAIMQQTTGQTLPPSMYLLKKVRWVIELNDGQSPLFRGLLGNDKKGERGLERLVPNWKRAGKVIRPLLYADKPSYALGIRVPDAKADVGRNVDEDAARTQEEFAEFKKLARLCAEATQEPDAFRIAEFLTAWNSADLPLEVQASLTRDHIITFKVNDRFIDENAKVRQFWARYGQEDESEETTTSPLMQCLVSGVRGGVEEMMPVPVKGLAGGKSEMAIVSANAAAFESYGLKRAQTSPICRDAGERFGQALNSLLASPTHHVLLQNVTYIYWSPGGNVGLAMFDETEAQKFLNAAKRGQRIYAVPPDAPFYLFGLSANAARVAVRTAIQTTVGDIEARQVAWFRRLSIIGFDEQGQPNEQRAFPLKFLAVAAFREFKGITPGVEDGLLRAALLGEPVPPMVLQHLTNRCRAERKVTHARAALIKYILTHDWSLEDTDTMINEVDTPQLPGPEGGPAEYRDPNENRAYHLGRLFAELEAVQQQAIPGINAGIADKFYGSASATPAAVFGTLLDGAQNHLSKLRKEREGAYSGAQKRIEDITLCLDAFPKTLTLKAQAYFSLGYYHHRAARRKAIMEASAAKKAKQTAVELDTDVLFPEGDDND